MAESLTRGLGDTEIISIPGLMKEENWCIEGEHVGFIFPCYYGTVPQIIRQFIRGASIIESRYFFSFVSAGRSTGIALREVDNELKKRGKILHYGKSVQMVSNYMNGWYYSLVMPEQDKKKRLLSLADQICKKGITEILSEKESVDKSSFINYLIPQTISPGRYTSDTRSWDSEFSVSDDCTGCGICAQSCPVGNIILKEGNPEFQHNCQRCMGCVQFCPTQSYMISNKSMKKERYSHPEIKFKILADFHRTGRMTVS